jgi:hypothetical protein
VGDVLDSDRNRSPCPPLERRLASAARSSRWNWFQVLIWPRKVTA